MTGTNKKHYDHDGDANVALDNLQGTQHNIFKCCDLIKVAIVNEKLVSSETV